MESKQGCVLAATLCSIRFLPSLHMSPVKRICVFEHSVMTNFNCACPAIQRGQESGFLSEGSSWFTARICDKYQIRLTQSIWFQNCEDDYPIKYCFGGKLVYLRRLQAETKVHTEVMSFSMLMTWQRMPQQRGKYIKSRKPSCDNYDLKIITKTTEVEYRPAHAKPYNEPNHHSEWTKTASCWWVKHSVKNNVHWWRVIARVARTSLAFRRIRGNDWDQNETRLDTN